MHAICRRRRRGASYRRDRGAVRVERAVDQVRPARRREV